MNVAPTNLATSGTRVQVGGTDYTGAFSTDLGSLTQGTTYYFEAYATNPAGTSYGSPLSFTAAVASTGGGGGGAVVPVVVTDAADGITAGGATLHGSITYNGGTGITGYGFYYSTSPLTFGNTGSKAADSFTAPVNYPFDFSYSLEGLKAGTTYYFRAYTVSTIGEADGAVLTFVIPAAQSPPSPPAMDIIGSVQQAAYGQTLVFKFDPASLSPQDHPAVYFYDGARWVRAGGTASGDTVGYTAAKAGYYYLNEDGRTADDITIPADAAASWAKDAIANLYAEGMNGYADGSFRPDRAITRAEFATIVGKAMELAPITPAVPTYLDVAPGSWYYGYVEACTKAGLTVGRGRGVFDPDAPITRQEIAEIIVKAAGKAGDAAANGGAATAFTDNSHIAGWARDFVAAADKDHLMTGYPDGSFGSLKNATRAECCQTIWNEIGRNH